MQTALMPQSQCRTWTGSVPPRGSGWVRSRVATEPIFQA